MQHDSTDPDVGGRRPYGRGLAGAAGLLGVAAIAWAGSGFAGGIGAVPRGDDALVAGATVLYGLVLLGAAWAGRGGRDVLVLGTLLGVGAAVFVAGPLGAGLVAPVSWAVLVATLSLVVGLPAVLLAIIESSVRAGPSPSAGV